MKKRRKPKTYGETGFELIIAKIKNYFFERDVKRNMPKSDKAILEKARRIKAEREHEQKVARARDKIRLDNRFKGRTNWARDNPDNYDEDGEALIG